jgi:hypothetical protein
MGVGGTGVSAATTDAEPGRGAAIVANTPTRAMVRIPLKLLRYSARDVLIIAVLLSLDSRVASMCSEMYRITRSCRAMSQSCAAAWPAAGQPARPIAFVVVPWAREARCASPTRPACRRRRRPFGPRGRGRAGVPTRPPPPGGRDRGGSAPRRRPPGCASGPPVRQRRGATGKRQPRWPACERPSTPRPPRSSPPSPPPHRLKRLGEALCRGAQHARADHPDAGFLVGDAGVEAR